MKKNLAVLSCGLLFFIGLIALLVGLFMMNLTKVTDNNDYVATVTPTVEVRITGTVAPTPTNKPNDAKNGYKLVEAAQQKNRTFKGPYFTVEVPAGWAVMQKSSDKNTYYIIKDNFYIEISQSIVTGAGYGYPYNGVCKFEETKGGFATTKFDRVDYIFNINNTDYDAFTMLGCQVDTTKQTNNQLWLGSRLIDKNSITPAINPYKYFNISQNGSALAYFINYGNTSLNNLDSKYPIWDSNELNDVLTNLDGIAGSVIFTESPASYTHTDGLG